MCGIVGTLRLDGSEADSGAVLVATSLLTHRGPDDAGLWHEGPLAIGHRRLSIIDIGGSRQPMVDRQRQLVLGFNGEILNYRSIRRHRSTYPYRTQGDTESILAVYAAAGAAGFSELEGQFAFALWDGRRRQLHLARDRLGILPLYYHADAFSVTFASEIKAILHLRPDLREIDELSIADYLLYRSVPAPDTLFAGIKKVLPGHILTLSPEAAAMRRYWTPPTATSRLPPDEVVEGTRSRLSSAVAKSLVADVDVGAYLSGGLDSSVVAAVAAAQKRKRGERLLTFTAGFGEAKYDERPFARLVSEAIGSLHHEVAVTPERFLELWPHLTWLRDAPLSEPADVAVHLLARSASEHVKVVLSGEGADEIFGGYPKYRYARLTRPLPPWARQAVTSTARYLPGRLFNWDRRIRTGWEVLVADDRAERLQAWFAAFGPHERELLLQGCLDSGGHGRAQTLVSEHPADGAWQMAYLDSQIWLPDNLLERGDRMSMGASVEVRPPYLDAELVDFAFGIPSKLKVRRGETKWPLRQVAKGLLPEQIVQRPKVGFRLPLSEWFRSGLADFATQTLLDPNSFATRYLSTQYIRELLARHATHGTDEIRIWTLLSLEVWYGQVFGGATSRGGDPGAIGGLAAATRRE